MNRYNELKNFRFLFGKDITKEECVRIWGEKHKGTSKGKRNIFVNQKVEIAKKNIPILLVGNLVKFIGISGSVGSGFAKEEDDIDIFVVTRNGTMWLYRALVQIKTFFIERLGLKVKKM